MSCSTYGHAADACSSPLKCSAPITIIDSASGMEVSSEMDRDEPGAPSSSAGKHDFGEWMIVGRPVRRPPRDRLAIESKAGAGNLAGNRFAALSDSGETWTVSVGRPKAATIGDVMRVVAPRPKRVHSDSVVGSPIVFSARL
ncbi:hypothetical protein Tsubulata_002234 [Turnera subulata]|uniref:Uncharacterized protein n=1 Tax=Turnera subulata TaxID=218843 RepID=A0A9Q0F8D0_9ROSI|nr:hypothetical protein Tsubulata_002234 [Turnera subulata]